ncbi:MAG: cytochrome c biogenesis protein CcsA [Candidatus Marinimicrobia bacterium]|nr:cytochrome c biogenesis protein CcsA [Candidatus Neomarinimicrobiota bacterium]
MKNNSYGFVDFIGLVALMMIFIALVLVFGYAPMEKTMGMAQKIFYFHVPSAFMAFASFAVVFVASILYLKSKNDKYDRVASSAAEVGTLFALIVLLTGPIWARSAWGVWWTWEPRLTTTLILFLIFIGYLMLRNYGAIGEQMKKYSAVVGIVGFLDVPIVYTSINWWSPEATAHPQSLELEASMKFALTFSFVTFSILLLFLILKRIDLERLRNKLEAKKANYLR